jgi:hypothetical protein
LAAFLLEQHLSGIEPKLPILQAGSQDWQSAASDWAANHQPDIILTDYPDRWDISGIPTMGFAISDIENSQVQGIIENNREIGIGAADALVGLLYQNERGVPGCRRTILVDPREGFLAIP